MSKIFQSCSRCVMNNEIDDSISFNFLGLCNHCELFDKNFKTRTFSDPNLRNKNLKNLVSKIKHKGKNKSYDCLIGVSGGVDSTYVAYLTKKLGLRPLAVHFDNGWNSDLAVSNIEKILKKLNIDLITYVVDWNEFRDLQISFLKASVPDLEIPTDHGINATLWRTASKYNIKFIISGMNFATESSRHDNWSYGHSDWKYIKSIHSIFGNIKLKTFPNFTFFYLFYIYFFKNIKTISLLNYIDYKKNKAVEVLEKELDWKNYEGKHFESTYTKFIQSYYLPKKFKIDKRYGHYSDLINSKQMTKKEANEILKKKPYDENKIYNELKFIRKKLDISETEFEEIFSLPVKNFRFYKNNFIVYNLVKKTVDFLRSIKLYYK